MMRTIGWLILMWCGIGFLSILVYIIGSLIMAGYKLHRIGDKEGLNNIFGPIGDEALSNYTTGIAEWVLDHPKWTGCPLALVRWDICAKVWSTQCLPVLKEYCNDRVKNMSINDKGDVNCN